VNIVILIIVFQTDVVLLCFFMILYCANEGNES